jgi:UV DNA damage endonuclease
MDNLGYCCINLTLREKGIYTNRSMIKKTFLEKGPEYAGELALLNIRDLFAILEWNVANNIRIFRISSTIFPWMSEYDFEDLPNFNEIESALIDVGMYIIDNNLRVGFHPGQFCVLPSPTPKVVNSTIDELDKAARILDLMGLPINHKFSLNIHVGGSYGDKDDTLKRFCENFSRLSESAQKRLVVENDDKASQYSVQDLYSGIYSKIKVPITFDFFHHTFCTGDLSTDDAAQLAASTWPDDIRPLAHYSSSKKINEDSSVVNRSHADYIYEQIPDISDIFDIEIEAKSKELALIKYINQYKKEILV